MENKTLLEKVSNLGFPLFEVEEQFDVNQTLADVVKSKNLRLLEGFAVLLANAAKESSFSFSKVNNYLTKNRDKQLFKELLLLSLSLYKAFNLYFDWAKNVYMELSKEDMERVKKFRNHFVHDQNFKLKEYTFSYERLKNVFMAYFKNEAQEVKKQTERQEDYSLEYALSQVFSPKQKDLVLKRAKGDRLNKTEREYYSRTVKKKLLALANSKLSRLAQLVLE